MTSCIENEAHTPPTLGRVKIVFMSQTFSSNEAHTHRKGPILPPHECITAHLNCMQTQLHRHSICTTAQFGEPYTL